MTPLRHKGLLEMREGREFRMDQKPNSKRGIKGSTSTQSGVECELDIGEALSIKYWICRVV